MADDFQIDTFKSIVSFAIAMLTGVGAYWFKRVDLDIKEIKNDIATRGERLKAVETSLSTVDKRLDRIETKLDILIEKKLNP